jgi:origin recognition complex subunit 1
VSIRGPRRVYEASAQLNKQNSQLKMPHREGELRSKENSKASEAERARRYLAGAAVAREDSDDELGTDDLPWEWIFNKPIDERYDDKETSPDADNQSDADDGYTPGRSGRKRKASQMNGDNSKTKIIGARMGSFECKVGDCVLLKAESSGEAWVGLICDFVEDDEEDMAAHFMWFATEKEIRNKEKKRKDFLQVR